MNVCLLPLDTPKRPFIGQLLSAAFQLARNSRQTPYSATPSHSTPMFSANSRVIIVLDLFEFRLMSAVLNDNRRREMAIECQAMRRADDGGNRDQAAAWCHRLSQNPSRKARIARHAN